MSLSVPVGKTVIRSTGSLSLVLQKFESFVTAVESLYGVSLPRSQFESLRDVSKFCLGLVEKDLHHPWRRVISSLGTQSRFGIAHSLFLFRKVIPKEKPSVDEYLDKMASPQEAPDADFLRFARRLTRRIFPVGWDRSYQDACLSSSLPLSACAEGGRSKGGCRGLAAVEFEDRADFCTYVLQSVVPRQRGVSRVQAIDTGGKWRIISIPPLVDNALRPLHKAMYSHLSRFEWLLRGDAKPSRFKDFTPVDGEVFVSGDYESATDNLNSDLQQSLLEVLLERSGTVPTGIREHALQTYRSSLVGESGRVVGQRRGQLMGQLTSFPLLCLVNYITFRYSIPRDTVPVRINGDDIVFRATPDEVARWERNVAKGGLTLSKGKTLIHSRGFTLNSTPFWSNTKGASLVGFVRSSALFPSGTLSEQICSLNGRFYSACAGYGRARQRVVRELFLDLNQKAVHASRRSVTRGLGLAVGEESLKTLGLWYRELFYCEQVEEPPLPVLADGPLPEGWSQVSRNWFSLEDQLRWKREWISACVDHAWSGRSWSKYDASEDIKMSKIRELVSPYGLGSLMRHKVRHMLKMTRSQAWRWVNLRRNPSVFGRVRRDKGSRMWVEVDLLATRTQVDFVRATWT
jgi:hypothetical protein